MKAGFRIKAVTVRAGGVTYKTHRLTGYLNGERIRKNFKSRDEADGEKARLEIQAGNSSLRSILTRLTEAQVAEAETAFAHLGGQSLAGAVAWYLANYKPPVSDMPLADVIRPDGEVEKSGAISAFLADRKPHVRPPAYRDYAHTLDAFAKAFPGCTVDSVKSGDVSAYLAGRGVGKKRFNNLRGDLNAFFAFCVSKPRQWTRENPVAEISKFRITRGLPEILTPEKCAEVMAFVETYKGGERSKAQPGCLAPYFALCLFGGLRPSVPHGEVWKLAQHNPEKLIDSALGVIRITPEISKVKSIRQVKIRPNLAAWLKRYPLEKFPLIPTNAQALITEVRKKFALGDDVLRHTFISAHVAKWKSLGEAALEAGNSEAMIRKHYLNMLSEAQAEAFWGIVPKAPAEADASAPENVVAFAAA